MRQPVSHRAGGASDVGYRNDPFQLVVAGFVKEVAEANHSYSFANKVHCQARWASSAYTGGQSFGGMDGGNISDYENAVNMCGGRSFTTTRHNSFLPGSQKFGSNAPANMFQDPESVYKCFRNPILGVDNGTNGSIGNLRGMPFWNVDFNIKKNLTITEHFGAEFGATFTNVFNHNQLADPGQTYLTQPSDFGSLETSGGVFQVNNPRKIEIAVRLKF